ncbi:glycosyltransferase family 9 protein [Crassaminicella profunda]|uniref:glycosyltransferase family 9 protein n=1 Tax=Crassaminicella profunda TaxID=1286698 RepID=UPI001CA70FDA|nr:glycosyltransferase family 9 protein [Crassaminicella profunda]QZY55886.1 glycosyltransferase family 9 protein [Crassaminicella profunda]
MKLHASKDLASNSISNSTEYANLWPHISISKEFRKNIKNKLIAHKFPYTTNILIKTGGLGDFVQLTPVAKALKIKYPLRPVVAVINHSISIFDEHPYIDLAINCGNMHHQVVVKSLIDLVENVFDVRYISRAYGTWKNTDCYYANSWFYDHFPQSGLYAYKLNQHVCDLMLYSLGLDHYANCNDVFIAPDLMIKKVSGDYVVVSNSPGSIEGGLKRWTSEEWDELIKWLHLKKIIPVQLGLRKDPLIHSTVMDLRGKTTPRQAAGYLKLSKGYVGIEGGLSNLAKAVGTPSVVIFGPTSAINFAYPDTHVVTNKLCPTCLWSELWPQVKCLKGNKTCLNLPDWKSVATEVSKMLKKGDA